MALPDRLAAIKSRLQKKAEKSNGEKALLSELEQIEQRISQQQLNEINARVTKMTSPGGASCDCCGRPY